MIKKLPPKEEILSRYDYDKINGSLLSKYIRYKGRAVGVSRDGYLRIGWRKNGKKDYYSIHRIIYFLETGEQPELIDHIDGDTKNNKFENLREITHQENQFNRFARLGKSEYKGVWWDEGRQKWVSSIKINQKAKHIGYFSSEIEAAKAYDKEALDLFGEFCNLNFN